MQKELLKKITAWIKKNKVLDVVIFGSSRRGKASPKDIDLCILINDADEKRSLDLVDSLGGLTEGYHTHVNILTASSFVKGNTLIKTLLTEGYSVLRKKSFAAVYGFGNRSLFIYSLKGFTSSKRVRFHYLLKGRYDEKGLLSEIGGEIVGAGTITVSTEKEDLLKEIMDRWKVEYKIKRVLG